MTSNGELKTMNRHVLLMPHFVTLFANRFPAGRWSFTQFSELRVHCLEETLKSKGSGTLSIHFCTIETVFRTIISVNQLSIY